MASRNNSLSTTMTTIIAARGQSSIHCALAIAELLDNIFAHLERHDAAHASQVSRGWVEIGRDHVWREVYTPCQLFGILAPISHHERGTYNPGHFFPQDCIISEEVLTHFLSISQRVRVLQSQSSKEECDAPNDHLLADNQNRQVFAQLERMLVARNKTLFPRLVSLRWWDTETPMVSWPWFGSTALDTISMQSPHCLDPKEPPSLAEPQLHSLARLAPHLQVIIFTSPGPGVDTEVVYVDTLDGVWPHFFSSLKKLTRLCIPLYFMTSAAFAAASASTSLTRLEIHMTTDVSFIVRKRRDRTDFLPPVPEEGSFPKLNALALAASLDAIINLMRDVNFPAHRLQEFGVRAIQSEQESSVRAFISALAQRARMALAYLNIQLASPSRFDDPIEEMNNAYYQRLWDRPSAWEEGLTPRPSERLCAATFLPLHGCVKLVSLNIVHRHPVLLNDDELVELVQELPALTALSLVPAPVTDYPPTLTLNVLGRIAHVRPAMDVLRLYLDASRGTAMIPKTPDARFAATLRFLWLNESPIGYPEDEHDDIASYLVQLLPTGTGLDTRSAETIDNHSVCLWDHVPPSRRSYTFRWRLVAELIDELRSGHHDKPE